MSKSHLLESVSEQTRAECAALIECADGIYLERISAEEGAEKVLEGLQSKSVLVQRYALRAAKRLLALDGGLREGAVTPALAGGLLGVLLNDEGEANKKDASECLLFCLREKPEMIPQIVDACVGAREEKEEKVKRAGSPDRYVPWEMSRTDEAIQRLWIATIAENKQACGAFSEKQTNLMADMLDADPSLGLQWRSLWFFKRLTENNAEAIGDKARGSLERVWTTMKKEEPAQAAMVGEILKALGPSRTVNKPTLGQNNDGMSL